MGLITGTVRGIVESSNGVKLLLAAAALAIWIGGVLYCEQVAQEKGYQVWVARILSLVLPIIGPAIYWVLGMRRSSGPPNEL
jgi:hypothetical protein